MNTIDIKQELSQNFIDFSHEANCQRAFADARDGLKPGQRACLWEMYNKGYLSNKPHVKSAKISGGVIATWWPHGDTAIYDTFARMSQSWINNIPEVDWHGANGSIQISGEPAASRYTEARLAKVTEEGLLGNIKKHNVPMKLNFSEDEEWPQVLPALMPRLMVNGCQGIGSTIANVWLPHSLSDLADIVTKYIKTGEIDYDNIAPNFPTGGIIINKNDLSAIYKTGRGKVILRGKAEIKGKNILITEIPYQVYVEPFITQIKNLIEKDELSGINNILNKSDKKRLLIEIECEDNPASILTQLYKKTSLQKSYSANQFALVGKTPKLLTLKEYLDIYIQHNYDCIKRENEYDLKKAKDRLEIVEGLIKALEDIDNIIILIKKSESSSDAVKNLISKYQFTERQAKAIVDMKLGRLAHLEKIELNQEQKDLTSTIEKCNEIINNIEKQKEIYLERFSTLVKKYGDKRRTEIVQIDLPKNKKEKEVAEVVPEDVVVVISKTGMIKRIPRQSFKTQRRNGKGVKNEGDLNLETISTNTVDNLMFFTDKGKMYRLLVDKVPVGNNTTKGTYVGDFIKIEPTEKVIAVTSLHKNTNAQYVLFITKKGMVKKTYLKEYTSTNRNNGIIAIKLKDNDTIANVTFVNEEELILLSKNNHAIRFETKKITPIGRNAAGVIGMKLTDDDEIITGLPIKHTTDDLAIFNEMGLGKKIKLSELPSQNRGGKGVLIFSKGNCQGGCLIDDKDKILILGQTNSICIESTDVPTLGRTADGNIMIKGTRIKKVIKI